ncbi:aspartate kinase [Ornithinibacillus bavariensis]|uniref:Aspartokinase n=1 Tax=Ornithinibacillus bavariensis TaxID=545502 RepID=A0A920C724_9BACI|nr:aspartate kinase [Ornithinibacillus bavariensis]GIO28541.1 aspartokinase [Ornithinibacillus bavariensis]
MKVAKFGGSSLASAEQIKKVGEIIKSDPKRKFVIVSAPGKQNKEDRKMTDLLIDLANTSFANQPYEELLQTIIIRFYKIITDLGLNRQLLDDIHHSILHNLKREQSAADKMDLIKSIGEDSSAKIVSDYLVSLGLEAYYVNPKEAGILVSDEPGNAQILPESFEKIKTLRERSGILVIPGFFGYTKAGKLVTFSRGGSDITGSIIAAGIHAELYENFTDVDSVYSVNPTIVENPKEIKVLTYKEMRELSYAGFTVFHDEALIPAFKRGIPVAIKNTNNPHLQGTFVVSEKKEKSKAVVGIASDTGFSTLYVGKYLMNREIGFGRRLLQILEDEQISFEHAPSGIDDISVIIRERQFTPEKEVKVLERIKEELHPDSLSLQHGLALIMIVGEGIMETIGIAEKAATALAHANVNIKMINQGSSYVSMMFGIDAKDLNKGVNSLYKVFFDDDYEYE